MRDRTIIYCTAFLRSMGIGMASVLLAFYLVKTGHGAFQVGMVIAAGLGGVVRMAGPSLSGCLMGFVSLSAPLFISAGLKTLYDGLLYREFRAIKPPEES